MPLCTALPRGGYPCSHHPWHPAIDRTHQRAAACEVPPIETIVLNRLGTSQPPFVTQPPDHDHCNTTPESHGLCVCERRSTWAVKLPGIVADELRALEASGDVEAQHDCGLRYVAELCSAHLWHVVRTAEGFGPWFGLHFFVYDGEREVPSAASRSALGAIWLEGWL